MPKFILNRRNILRGILGGTTITVGLPLLECMLNANGTAYASGERLPLRFVSYYWADGVNLALFEPEQTGDRWALSQQMAPLEPVKDYINVVTGLQNHCALEKTHHDGMTVFNGYTLVDLGALDSNAGGPTIDQVIADAIGDAAPVRAVHVRVSKRESTDGDGGSTVTAMSHRGSPGNLTPQIPEANPQEVWKFLFGNFVPERDDRTERVRVLDAVRNDVARLRTKLGTMDNQRLDAHLQGVSELETKIQALPPACELPGIPSETNTDIDGAEPITSVVQAMSDLIAYAFSCDVTRVATFLFKKFVSSTVFTEIGATEQHHSSSHDPDVFNNNYVNGVTYSMAKLSQFLQTLRNTTEVTGENLLDSTIVYASTCCSTGWVHSIERQPILIAGHGRNYLQYPGIHYQATPWNGRHELPNAQGNTSDALLTCLRAFAPDAESVGGGEPISTTPLTDIIA